MIGGYESAYCSDLVVAYIFDKIEKDKEMFKGVSLKTKKGRKRLNLIYNKIYQDDGIIVTEKK